MTTEKTIPELTSIDTKLEGILSKEDECEYFRQRCYSLKILLEEYQNKLTHFKNRCLGVDTIVLALKESKQENVKISKHVKALETAISVLQKRLTKNGLSNSVNVQETELFVPGASKQTLDNLAKETARLRSLLKQENAHLGKKSSNEIEEMKAVLEEAEVENNKLKNKLRDMEALKLELIKGYERDIEKLTKEREDEKIKFEQEMKALSASANEKESRPCVLENRSVGCQADVSYPTPVQELKDLLQQTIEKCVQLDGQLPFAGVHQINIGGDTTQEENAGSPSVPQEDYVKLEVRYQEAIKMNQNWQTYNKGQEKHIQSLNDQIKDLTDTHHITAAIEEGIKQRTADMSYQLNFKDAEILDLHKQVQILSKEITDVRRWQSHQENSTVEILKQQIQVCTEDFNTERKDREQAVQKSKALQDENDLLKAERTSLRKQIEQQKRMLEQQKEHRGAVFEAQPSSHLSSGAPPPPYSSQLSQGSSGRYLPSLFPVQESHATQCVESLGPSPSAIPFSDYQRPLSATSQGSVYPPTAAPNLSGSYSMPRGAPISFGPSNPSSSNSSMPPLVSRGGSTKEEVPCPKCSKKFSDDTLLSHIDHCEQ